MWLVCIVDVVVGYRCSGSFSVFFYRLPPLELNLRLLPLNRGGRVLVVLPTFKQFLSTTLDRGIVDHDMCCLLLSSVADLVIRVHRSPFLHYWGSWIFISLSWSKVSLW